jgi:hypothetical protein
MAQGRSTKVIWMIGWIWTSRLSIHNSLSHRGSGAGRTELAFLEKAVDFFFVSAVDRVATICFGALGSDFA